MEVTTMASEKITAIVESVKTMTVLAVSYTHLDVYKRQVGQLIEELFARTGYLAAVGAMPDGARCRDDLLAFAAWACLLYTSRCV